jgi:hypothetical protein
MEEGKRRRCVSRSQAEDPQEEKEMAAAIVEMSGIVRPDGTLELDQKLTVPPGRVKVRVEPVETPTAPAETLVEFVDRTRRELAAAGHKFMNDEEVTAWIEELRADDDRLEEIYRQAEEEKRRLEQRS